MTRTFPPPWLALFVAYGLGVTGALGDLPRSPEHEAQLFFADHVFHDWWGATDPRWYGGVDVTQVPLTAAQLVALLAKVPPLGVERAYALIVALAGVLGGLGAVRLARALPPVRSQGLGWLTLAAAASPVLWLGLIPLGLLPGALALGFALNAGAWARSRHRLAGAATAACAAAAAAAHPVGLVVFAATAPALASRLRTVVGSVVGLAVGLAAAWVPLRSAVASWSVAPNALPDWVRLAALGLAAVALAGAARERSRRSVGVAIVAGGLALAAPWGSAVLPPALALAASLTLGLVLLASLEGPPRWPALLAAGLVFALTAAGLGMYRNSDTRSRRAALRDVEWVLANAQDGERYRFVSLGVGREWVELTRRVRPRALDGALDWLHPSWDALASNDPQAVERLAAAVRDPTVALRWAIVGAPGWDEPLTRLGFRNVGAWRGNVTLWQRDDAPPQPPEPAPWQRAPWAIVVLGPVVALAAIASALAGLREFAAAQSEAPPLVTPP